MSYTFSASTEAAVLSYYQCYVSLLNVLPTTLPCLRIVSRAPTYLLWSGLSELALPLRVGKHSISYSERSRLDHYYRTQSEKYSTQIENRSLTVYFLQSSIPSLRELWCPHQTLPNSLSGRWGGLRLSLPQRRFWVMGALGGRTQRCSSDS